MKKKEDFKICISIIILTFFITLVLPIRLATSSVTSHELSANQTNVNADRIIEGIDLIYNHQFDKAEDLFQEIISKTPYKPVGYFYLAMVTWSRLATGFWSSESVKEYKERIDRTIIVAERPVSYTHLRAHET